MCRYILFIAIFLIMASSKADLKESTRIKVSNLIQTLVDKKLAENKQRPNKPVSDLVFLRRVYLDTIGRIPTLKETQEFLNAKGSDKRNKLIDKLLDSPGYVSHNFNYWADTFRATTKMRYTSGTPFINYIKESLRLNKPYDVFVREMLTSKGAIYAPNNGQLGYFLRDPNMNLDSMSNTMQVFLGTNMVCAQCHDHPFDRWTQMDFYKLAAFTSGMRVKKFEFEKNDKSMDPLKKLKQDGRSDPKLLASIQTFTNALFRDVNHTGTGMIRLPHDYDYDDAKPFDIITADVPFGDKVTLKTVMTEEKKSKRKKKYDPRKLPAPGKDINSREAFAKWVTSPNNPMFTKTIVNRMWEKYMGAPLVGDSLNLTLKGMGSNRELTELLIKAMKYVKYDLKEFSKIILKSKAYQREANKVNLDPNAKNYFAGPMAKRLSAEQLWDSMMSLTLVNPDLRLPDRQLVTGDNVIYKMYFSKKPSELAKIIRDVAKQKGKPSDYKANLVRNYFASNKDMSNSQESKKKGKDNTPKKGKLSRQLKRASELESPTDGGHFLRRFGQSERQVIDGSFQEASIPQALNLLNGKVEDYLISFSGSSILNNIRNAKSVEDKIKVAHLSILTRTPSSSEMSMYKELFRGSKDQATKDMIWVLVNTHEFMFKK